MSIRIIFLEEILILVIMMTVPMTTFRYLIKNKEKIILRVIMLLLLSALMILIEVDLL